MSNEVSITVPLEKDNSYGHYFTYTGEHTQYQIHLKLPNYESNAPEDAFSLEIACNSEGSNSINIEHHFSSQYAVKKENGAVVKPVTIKINDSNKNLLNKEAKIELFFTDETSNPEVKGTVTVAFKDAKKRDRLDNEDLPSGNE